MRLLLLLPLFWLLGTAGVPGASVVTADFLDTLEQIESRGNPAALGDGGKARGSFQMWAGAWADVNEARRARGAAPYPYSRATDRAVARQFAAEYLQTLETRFALITGRRPTQRQLWAVWNLGLEGFRDRGLLLSRCPRSTQAAAKRFAP